MFIKLFILILLIFKIQADEDDSTTYSNCDWDLLDKPELTNDQKDVIRGKFPAECLQQSAEDKALSLEESKKFDEFNKALRNFDGDSQFPLVDDYDQFYESLDLLRCNNKTLSYDEYIECILPKRDEMIELIKNATTIE